MAAVPDENNDTHPTCHPDDLSPVWDGVATVQLAKQVDQLRLPADAPAGRIYQALKQIDVRTPDRQTSDDIHRYRRPEAPSLPVTIEAPKIVAQTIIAQSKIPPACEHVTRDTACRMVEQGLLNPGVGILVTPGGHTCTTARWMHQLKWTAILADGTHDQPRELCTITSDPRVVVAADALEAAAAGNRWIGLWGVFILPVGQPVRQVVELGGFYRLLTHPDHPRLVLLCDDPDDPPGWPRLVLQALKGI